ncbi:MAG: ABC transporter permease [Xanthomonadales bacterium]|jgi:ABC-2 type transport system permease protein|nr:ABC transporter permease [Xanthomonadales bacterium]MDH3926071.1 ABC transporter permease [Xanthomonadales bacterium]MDH3940138.1 ABC transporter permease [Xanthomonadales bacterium]MDH4002350.1 ABC transporter permease [Xanthomonadales bacterium]
MNSLQRIFAIIVKELRQLSRDRLTFGMIIGIPTLQLLLFGYAINMDVRHLSAGVADLSNTAASRQVIQDMAQTQVIDINYQAADVFELETLMRQGKIVVGVYIPADYERRLQQPERSAIQLLVDGSDTVVQGAAASIARSARTSPFTDRPPEMEMRTYYNPERRSPVNTVPGLIGVILTMTMTLFTAVAIVRERERGNLELLITTPVRSAELMLAKILPYVFIGLIQVSLVLVLGVLLFKVPLRGALIDVYWVSLAFIIANLAMGLVVSTIAQTQFQAMQMTFFFLLPSILLSGFMFPFDGMPKAAQWIAEILPMTHFMRLIRGVVLRGASLSELSNEMAILWGFIAVAMTIAVLRFNKRLD